MALLLCFCVLILAIGLLPDGLPAAGLWWDFLIATGFCTLAIIAFLGWDSESPASNPRLRLHRNLGLLAALLCSVHSFGYLLLDSILLEYLLPSAPGYMLAGIVAFVCLLAVTVSSLPGPRKKFYGGFFRFRAWHRILFILILLGSGWHIMGTDFSLTSPWQLGAGIVLLGLMPLSAYASRRKGQPLPLGPAPPSTRFADRHTVGVGLAIIALCAAYTGLRYLACASC